MYHQSNSRMLVLVRCNQMTKTLVIYLLCRAQLSTAQIVEQVIEALRLASRESKAAAMGLEGAAPLPPITNIVFMGMGEPLHNLSAVMSAVDILCDNTGLQFSHNKVSHAHMTRAASTIRPARYSHNN